LYCRVTISKPPDDETGCGRDAYTDVDDIWNVRGHGNAAAVYPEETKGMLSGRSLGQR